MVLLLLSLLNQIPGSRVQKCCYALDNMVQEYETGHRQQHDLEVMSRTINFALPVDSALPSPQGRDKQRGSLTWWCAVYIYRCKYRVRRSLPSYLSSINRWLTAALFMHSAGNEHTIYVVEPVR